ncbi:unnamed protein product, partial [Amoebophrya sp. A120]
VLQALFQPPKVSVEFVEVKNHEETTIKETMNKPAQVFQNPRPTAARGPNGSPGKKMDSDPQLYFCPLPLSPLPPARDLPTVEEVCTVI